MVFAFKALLYFTAASNILNSIVSFLKTNYFKVVYPKLLLDFNNNLPRFGTKITNITNIQRYFISTEAKKKMC